MKLPAFYGTRRSVTAFTSAHHLSLSWTSSIQSLSWFLCKLKFLMPLIDFAPYCYLPSYAYAPACIQEDPELNPFRTKTVVLKFALNSCRRILGSSLNISISFICLLFNILFPDALMFLIGISSLNHSCAEYWLLSEVWAVHTLLGYILSFYWHIVRFKIPQLLVFRIRPSGMWLSVTGYVSCIVYKESSTVEYEGMCSFETSGHCDLVTLQKTLILSILLLGLLNLIIH
jgi:hypothetical protein